MYPRRAAPSLSLCTVTNSPPPVVTAFLNAWRPHVDELVLAVDERADPRTVDVCRTLVDRIYVVPSMPNMERYLGWLMSQCSSDWILRIDDDELPSAALIAAFPHLLASRAHTHYLLPCHWVYPIPDRFIASDHWVRDRLHPRLIRNISGLWRLTGRVHSDVEVLGPSAIVDAPFLHVTALLDDVETRRQRVNAYATIDPGRCLSSGAALMAFHLPEEALGIKTEELAPADAVCVREFLHEALTPASSFSGAPLVPDISHSELDVWLDERTLSDDRYAAPTRILFPVAPMRAGDTQHIFVEVLNAGRDWWPRGSQAWPLVRLGHHWRTLDGVPLGTPTPRAYFSERVAPGAITRVVTPIVAPKTPGTYVLAIDVVHEFVRWFGCETQQQVVVGPPARAASKPTQPSPITRVATMLLRPFDELHHRSRRRLSHREVLCDDLRLLHDTLSTTPFGTRYWVWGGLLLGWAREGRPLEDDLFDVDFGFDVRNMMYFAAAAGALMDAGFEPMYRYRNNAGQVTQYSFRRNRAKFEFFAVEHIGEMLRYYTYTHAAVTGIDMQNTAAIADQPIESFRFLRRKWRKHVDHGRELTALYGDWCTPDPDWSYLQERTIVARDPWRLTDSSWTGEFAGPTGSF